SPFISSLSNDSVPPRWFHAPSTLWSLPSDSRSFRQRRRKPHQRDVFSTLESAGARRGSHGGGLGSGQVALGFSEELCQRVLHIVGVHWAVISLPARSPLGNRLHRDALGRRRDLERPREIVAHGNGAVPRSRSRNDQRLGGRLHLPRF